MIFILNGPPGTGKDEACSYLETLGYTHLSFKYELFKETFKQFNVSKEWFMPGYNDRSIKEKYDEVLGMSRRDAMIYTSEVIIKPRYGNDYFGKSVANQLKHGGFYCCSDGGFVEEILPIINKLGKENVIILQLTREGCDFSSDSRRYFDGNITEEYIIDKKTLPKVSDILQYKFPLKLFRIHNNGQINQLKETLKLIVEKERHARKQNTTET